MSRLAKIFGIASVVLFLMWFLMVVSQKIYLLARTGRGINYNNPYVSFFMRDMLPYFGSALMLACLFLVVFFFLARKAAKDIKTKTIVNSLGAIGLPALILVFFIYGGSPLFLSLGYHGLFQEILFAANAAWFLWIVPFTIVAIWALVNLKPKNQPEK